MSLQPQPRQPEFSRHRRTSGRSSGSKAGSRFEAQAAAQSYDLGRARGVEFAVQLLVPRLQRDPCGGLRCLF